MEGWGEVDEKEEQPREQQQQGEIEGGNEGGGDREVVSTCPCSLQESCRGKRPTQGGRWRRGRRCEMV